MCNLIEKNNQLIKTERYIIYLDEIEKIRIKIKNQQDNQLVKIVSELVELVNKINNLPLDEGERNEYKRDIANIYQIGINDNVVVAKKYGEELKKEIEKNLMIRKKQELFMPVAIGLVTLILAFAVFVDLDVMNNISYSVIYGSLGGLLSVIIKNNSINIDYNVKKELLKFESFKLIILPSIMAIIGGIAIKSRFIFGDLYLKDELIYLIYVICGYSQTFIPNILKNFESNINNNGKVND